MSKHSKYYKYPRTLHLPWSLGIGSDDKVMQNTICFKNKQVVITEKMDRENTTLYSDYMHARSIDSKHHPSRNIVKALHAEISHKIPENWRLCGENMFAKHSISYNNLESYFYLFSVWNENNCCLSWSETKDFARKLNLSLPTVLYHGIWNEKEIKNLLINEQHIEGYVVRTEEGFHYDSFSMHYAKWVRANHVQSEIHWMHQEIIPNTLKDRN